MAIVDGYYTLTRATKSMIRLDDKFWQYLKPFFPDPCQRGRPQKWKNRDMLEAILYVLCNGLKWSCLPTTFPPKSTVYNRFRQWIDKGVFVAMRDMLLEIIHQGNMSLDICFVDATFVRAIGGGEQIGKTKIGKGNKIMAIVDQKSRPIAAIACSAQHHEITLLQETLEDCPVSQGIKNLVGDKAYDSDEHDILLKKQGINLIAPHKRNRQKLKTQDGRQLRHYKKRWLVERLFAWMKPFRRLLIRFDKKISVFQAFLDLFSSIVILRRSIT